MAEKITITLTEYEELKADARFLANLQAAGVDNWEGYGFGYGEDDVDDDY